MDKNLRKNQKSFNCNFFFSPNTALSSNRAKEGVGVKGSPAEPHHQRGRSPTWLLLLSLQSQQHGLYRPLGGPMWRDEEAL